VSLVARHLEVNSIPTVILGAARDVVEHCGVPRFLFTDFPLGNPCGKPWDADMQRHIVGMGLGLLECATEPRTTLQTPFVWSDDSEWRERYMRVDPAARERLRRLGDLRRAAQSRAKVKGRVRDS
jgi:D-proline reductase (dithiol) PrdB